MDQYPIEKFMKISDCAIREKPQKLDLEKLFRSQNVHGNHVQITQI